VLRQIKWMLIGKNYLGLKNGLQIKNMSGSEKMICEMCLKDNAESRGLHCGKYKICGLCVNESIHARMWLIGRVKE